MVDFSSALYLGNLFSTFKSEIQIPISIGKPAFLKETSLNRWVGNQIAKMQGLERGIIAPSALHLFWDLFGILQKEYVIFIEENTYPIGQWGVIHSESRGFEPQVFDSKSLSILNHQLHRFCSTGLKPIIVSDSINLDSGEIQPIETYLNLIKPYNGILLIDDTQTFGLFGKRKPNKTVFGSGGGGILPYLSIKSPNILSITSLSKAFGLPISVLSGNAKIIKEFEQNSLTRIHTSQVSNIHALAAAQIIETNKNKGDFLREKLWNNIRLFEKNLRKLDSVKAIGGIFPVQQISFQPPIVPSKIYQKLLEEGIECLLLAPTNHSNQKLGFCLRADHTQNEIIQSTHILKKILQSNHTSKPLYHFQYQY